MTMARPDFTVTKWLIGLINPKTIAVGVFALVIQLYTLKADIRHDEQQLENQAQHIDAKVEKDAYDRDVRTMSEQLNRIETSIDGIHRTLEEKR